MLGAGEHKNAHWGRMRRIALSKAALVILKKLAVETGEVIDGRFVTSDLLKDVMLTEERGKEYHDRE